MRLNRYVKIRIWDDKREYSTDDILGITAGSLNLEELLCDTELKLGQSCSNKFECEIFFLEDTITYGSMATQKSEDIETQDDEIIMTSSITSASDVSGMNIEVSSLENNILTPIFRGIIDSSTTDYFGYHRKIVAYDALYYLRDTNVADWWESYWTDRPSTTLLDIVSSMCENVGVSYYIPSTIPNITTLVQNYNHFTSITFGELISMAGEMCGCFPHINRSGALEFIQLAINKPEIWVLDKYEKVNSEFEDFIISNITGVSIYDSSDHLLYNSNEGGNINNYIIAGNVFLLSLLGTDGSIEGLIQPCEVLAETVQAIRYTPCSVKMIVGDLSITLGTKVATDHGTHYVMKQTYSGSLFVEQQFDCVAHGEELNQKPTTLHNSIVSSKKYAEFDVTIEGIRSEVGETTIVANEAVSKVSSVEETASGIALSVVETTRNLNAEIQTRQDSDNALSSELTKYQTHVTIKNDGVTITQGEQDSNSYSKFTQEGMEIYINGVKTAWATSDGFASEELIISGKNGAEFGGQKWHLHMMNDGTTLSFFRR